MLRRRKMALAMGLGLLLAVSVCFGQACAQKKLSDKIVRLHVLANSDGAGDQAVKLKVRDAVLACADGGMPGEDDLERMRQAAETCLRENGYDDPVRVTLEKTYFDTRVYDGFALPAGRYQAVRVVIGAGAGHNWWCVIYPGLCTGFAEAAHSGVLTEDELAFIRRDGQTYVVRVKLQELLSQAAHMVWG